MEGQRYQVWYFFQDGSFFISYEIKTLREDRAEAVRNYVEKATFLFLTLRCNFLGRFII